MLKLRENSIVHQPKPDTSSTDEAAERGQRRG